MNVAVYQTTDARVLTLLRSRELTRYQILELLASQVERITESIVNKVLESLFERDLVHRMSGILYGLTKRGHTALALIDGARAARHVSITMEREAMQLARYRCASSVEEDPQVQLMKRGRIRATSQADLRPQPPRVGSLKFLECPSRWGNKLHYRDGRVTDLAGNPL